MKILICIAIGVFFERSVQEYYGSDGVPGLIKRAWEIGSQPPPKPYVSTFKRQ